MSTMRIDVAYEDEPPVRWTACRTEPGDGTLLGAIRSAIDSDSRVLDVAPIPTVSRETILAAVRRIWGDEIRDDQVLIYGPESYGSRDPATN